MGMMPFITELHENYTTDFWETLMYSNLVMLFNILLHIGITILFLQYLYFLK